MCKWICCCFYKKEKKRGITKKKKTDKSDKRQQTDRNTNNTSDANTADTPTQQIQSFYGKSDDIKEKTTKTKTPVNEWDRNSITLSEIPDSELTRTYNLPFKNCQTDTELVKHLGYELLSKVGKGGFGLVRKAYHTDKKTGQKRLLACKEIALNRKDRREHMIKSLKNEIYVLRKCKHPYIIGLEDHFIVNMGDVSKAYLFMEFADCDTLQTEINNGPLTDRVAKRYFVQIAIALAYLHRLKIAHKDLKPENIMLVTNTKTGIKEVRVGDFGLSENVYNKREGVIKMGHFGGTRGYMAPEILRLETYKDHRKVLALTFDPFKSDMWALGVCLYEMLTKNLPFEFHNLNNMLSLEEDKAFTYPRSVRDSIDSNADNLIRQLLEPDVAIRIDPLGVLTHPWIRDKVDLSLIKVPSES